jgi:hypothetical protein
MLQLSELFNVNHFIVSQVIFLSLSLSLSIYLSQLSNVNHFIVSQVRVRVRVRVRD